MELSSVPRVTLSRDAGLLQSLARTDWETLNFNPEELVKAPNLFLTVDNEGALFEYVQPGVYTGHYFFYSHGKKLLEKARLILDSVFIEYGAEIICGLTPVDLKSARFINAQLGFKKYDEIETSVGTMGLYILTKKEYTE